MSANGWYPAELRAQASRLSAHCKNYCDSNNAVATVQVAVTAILFLALAVLMFAIEPFVPLIVLLLLAGPAGALLVRLFAIQHDCGHGSYFSSRKNNELLGWAISIFTFTPYDYWRRSHAIHHAGSGNLARRGIGDIETKTVSEYQAMSPSSQWRYWLFRHPVISLLIGPPVYFLILQRTTLGGNLPARDGWLGIAQHNLALIVFYSALIYLCGFIAVLKIALPIILVATWVGGFLFFVQHQFEETLWEGADEWDVKIAALKGSSHLQLPAFLNWLTCDIGLHHIHHLCSRIPNYRLRDCMKSAPELEGIAPKLTLWEAIKGVRCALWDEQRRKLISFREYRKSFAT
jgi:acyl-lipid omega-6 desaturase (Delta-12 desaturase)